MCGRKWQLMAQNKSGANVYFYGSTQRAAIAAFDSEYSRKGFAIVLTRESGFKQRVLKSTYR